MVLKNGRQVKYHIFFFIWTCSKEFTGELEHDPVWLIGKGEHTNLWFDKWCSQTRVDLMQISSNMHDNLKAKLHEI